MKRPVEVLTALMPCGVGPLDVLCYTEFEFQAKRKDPTGLGVALRSGRLR